MTSLLHLAFPQTVQLEWLRKHFSNTYWPTHTQFYSVNKIETITLKNVTIYMSDIMDARTLRRLNRLKKRELNSTVLKPVEAVVEPVCFTDMPWYKLNLNMILDGESSATIKPEPLYVCKSCYEYNTAYSTDFVLVNDVVQDESIIPVDNSDSKSSNSSWTNVSSLKEDEIVAVNVEFSGTPIMTDLSGASVLADVSGASVLADVSDASVLSDVSGTTLHIATVREACAPCCIIS